MPARFSGGNRMNAGARFDALFRVMDWLTGRLKWLSESRRRDGVGADLLFPPGWG